MKRRITPNIFREGEDVVGAQEHWKDEKKRGPGGRPKKLKSPQQLWELACDYFLYCDVNPWVKIEYRGEFNKRVEIPTTRPYTWEGLDEFVRSQIGLSKLEDYKANKPIVKDGVTIYPYGEFSDVITRMRNIIYMQKIEGALVGAYDARIVSAELALRRKAESQPPKQVLIIGGQRIEL